MIPHSLSSGYTTNVLPLLPPSPSTITPPPSPTDDTSHPPDLREWFPVLEKKLRDLFPEWNVVVEHPHFS